MWNAIRNSLQIKSQAKLMNFEKFIQVERKT